MYLMLLFTVVQHQCCNLHFCYQLQACKRYVMFETKPSMKINYDLIISASWCYQGVITVLAAVYFACLHDLQAG